MREWLLVLPWGSPPLTLNGRQHWRVKAQWTKALRGVGWAEARRLGIPPLACCEVALFWAPPDRRRRDTDNLVATLKPVCDGLVDAGVVLDDTPEFMVKPMPVIVAPAHPPRLWVVVRELPAGGGS